MLWNWPEDYNHNLSLLDNLLIRRGISPDAKQDFLNVGVDKISPAESLYNTTKAAKVILNAIKKGKKIFIHGDYDVDGVCATAIMWDFLHNQLDADVWPYIPSRFDEGYGLSPNSVEAMKQQGAEVIITVDCGVKDIEIVDKYTAEGMEFVITDHHALAQDELNTDFISKQALAVVHPKYPEHNAPFVEICGAVVAWKLCCRIAEVGKKDCDMYEYLDLAAMATVCDVMPLIGENRSIVSLGLERLKQTKRPGLLALMSLIGIEPQNLEAYHLGFTLGPRLNAAGRMDSAMDALRLLTTSSNAQAADLAQKLNSLNSDRQQLTQELIENAEAQIAELPKDQKVLIVYGDNWPEGIVGLVAGKLTEKYHRPVLVASVLGDTIKGSARSVPGLHVANLFKQVEGLLERHGGHALAAGFTLNLNKFDQFRDSVLEIVQTELSHDQLVQSLDIDLSPKLEQLNESRILELGALEPFGFGNPKPVTGLRNLVLIEKRTVGKTGQFLKLKLADGDRLITAMEFSNPEIWQEIEIGNRVDVAGNLGINEWNNYREIQIILKAVQVVK